ncbi:MAG: hypothetical protein KAS32_30765, partial [Candidatus Peribacteraceae bacterium]|nr:hypothetical protein [Candidatus Peribacteraceae bacterium]
KFTDLDALTLLALADLVCVIDDVAGTPTSKKITTENFWKSLAVLNTEASPAVDDLIAVYDAGESTTDKMTLANVLTVVDELTALALGGGADADTIMVLDNGTPKNMTFADFLRHDSRLAIKVRYFQLEPFSFPDQTEHATGDGKATFIVPPDMDGMSLAYVLLSLETAGVDDLLQVQIRNETDSVDMLSTVASVDTTELTSATAATPYVIYDDGKEVVATGNEIDIDIDAIHSGTAGKGLIVTLGFS